MSVAVGMTLSRDPALPERDALLDTARMRDVLARVLGRAAPLDVHGCEQVRVNYQVGKSLRVAFQLDAAEGTYLVAARLFKRGRSAEAYQRAAAAAVPCGGVHPVAHIPPLECVLWTFPNDRKIEALPAIAAPSRDAAAAFGPPDWTASRIAAYAPEKSATFACLDARGVVVAYAKTTAQQQAERDHAIYQSLARALPPDDPHLNVPVPMEYSARHKTLWLKPVHGIRLSAFDGEGAGDGLKRFGAAVAAFHLLRVPAAQRFQRFDRDPLNAAVGAMVRVRPDVADRAADVVDRLCDRFREDWNDEACLHGDLHPKNAIVSGGRIALLDVEDLAAGPSAADIGSFVASLEYLRTADRIDDAEYRRRAGAFLDGYASRRALPPPAAIAWHTAASLLVERAVRAITRVRPLGLLHLSDLIARSARLLDGAGDV